VKVAVGSPASFVASEVKYDSHEGNAWVGAAMKRGRGGCQSGGRCRSGVEQYRENVLSSCRKNVKKKEAATKMK